jgi:2-polyprenyl-3-methyl-5-hydroxy-6-metoxy-1,4-benzoquinol methylase
MKKYSLIKNKKFGFFKIFPSPSKKELNNYYKKEFYNSQSKFFNNSSLKVQLEDKDFFNSRWENMYKSFCKFKKKNTILDIGCGWCQSLIYFKKKGYDCYGFDPSKEAVKYGLRNKLNVKHAGIDDIDIFGKKKFDIVTLLNVLEHLISPKEALSKIKNILNKKGLLVIDVPNDFNDFQLAARKLHNLPQWWVSPPRHLNYFSRDSLVKLLKSIGFKILDVEASFPLEIFLLFGDNYVKNPVLGKECHKKRIMFEKNLLKYGRVGLLNSFYKSLADLGLGRTITIYAQK